MKAWCHRCSQKLSLLSKVPLVAIRMEEGQGRMAWVITTKEPNVDYVSFDNILSALELMALLQKYFEVTASLAVRPAGCA